MASPFWRDERVVLLGIGVMTTAIVSSLYYTLKAIREDKVIRPVAPKTQYITQESEDALPLDTVDKLIQHPNFWIRDVATRILCDRAVNGSDALTLLLHGIMARDYDNRTQNLRTLCFLVRNYRGQARRGGSSSLGRLLFSI
jgi:hypothetical protein